MNHIDRFLTVVGDIPLSNKDYIKGTIIHFPIGIDDSDEPYRVSFSLEGGGYPTYSVYKHDDLILEIAEFDVDEYSFNSDMKFIDESFEFFDLLKKSFIC